MEIVAFTSTQFSGPHPSDSSYYEKFSIKFPLLSNVCVNGELMHPIYKYIKTKCKDFFDPATSLYQEIPWNFSKFLLNSNAEVIAYASPLDDLVAFRIIIEEDDKTKTE